MSEKSNPNSAELSSSLSKEDLELLQKTIRRIKKKYKLSTKEIIKEIESNNKTNIPTTIFSKKLSALETITKFLHENKGIELRKIANLTGRSVQNIYVTYKKSTQKQAHKFSKIKSEYSIPVNILQDNKLAVLESVVKYLHEELGLDFYKIGELLVRKYTTVWTVYQRAEKKRRQNEGVK